MLCCSWPEQRVHRAATALRRSCHTGLRVNHLRETAAHFASGPMLHHLSSRRAEREATYINRFRGSARNEPTVSSPDIEVLDSQPNESGQTIPRLLVVADAAVAEVSELPSRVRAVIDAAAEVYVLTPTLPGRLAWLADDVDRCRHAADERLDTVLGHMRSIGAHASGDALRGSLLTVLADAVAEFEPDHILVALRSTEHANWQERGLIEHVEERFGLPLTTFAIDPEGHVSTAPGPGTTSLA
jgi:hypothetical protein